MSIASCLSHLNRYLTSLDITDCHSGENGMISLFKIFERNEKLFPSLKTLSLSGNRLDSTLASSSLGKILSRCTQLKELNLSSTSIDFGAVVKEAVMLPIVSLDISGNILRLSEVKSFLRLCPSLSELNLSNCGITTQGIRDLLSIVPQLESLSLADNNLGDQGIISLEEILKENMTIKNLNLDRNFERKGPLKVKAMESLGSICNNSKIENLSITGNSKFYLKHDLIPFVISLIVNENLKTLNITGNHSGNGLAIALAKVLQTNNTLQTILWDDNNITLKGFQIIRHSLERNSTLTSLLSSPLDVSNALKSERSNLLETLQQIQEVWIIQLPFVNSQLTVKNAKSQEFGSDVILRENQKSSRQFDTKRASTLFGGWESLLSSLPEELSPEDQDAVRRLSRRASVNDAFLRPEEKQRTVEDVYKTKREKLERLQTESQTDAEREGYQQEIERLDRSYARAQEILSRHQKPPPMDRRKSFKTTELPLRNPKGKSPENVSTSKKSSPTKTDENEQKKLEEVKVESKEKKKEKGEKKEGKKKGISQKKKKNEEAKKEKKQKTEKVPKEKTATETIVVPNDMSPDVSPSSQENPPDSQETSSDPQGVPQVTSSDPQEVSQETPSDPQEIPKDVPIYPKEVSDLQELPIPPRDSPERPRRERRILDPQLKQLEKEKLLDEQILAEMNEEVEDDVPNEVPKEPVKVSGDKRPVNPIAVALYDFEGERENDLVFSEGDIICVLKKNPGGWWLGKANNKVGRFPSNFTEEIEVEFSVVKARGKFVAEKTGDLSIEEGEVINILKRDVDWFFGEIGGQYGWVPADFVEDIEPS